jgi:CheY-like chemotaxis protein/Trp operon repressor
MTINGHESVKLAHSQYIKYLRDALNHLFDPGHLNKNPLSKVINKSSQQDTPVNLKSILIEAIETLEPKSTEPSHSRSWRIYESLYYRYIQQLSQREVADQLGIGIRQLHREQTIAIDTLANLLWEKYNLAEGFRGLIDEADGNLITIENAAIKSELAWVKNTQPEKSTNLVERFSYLSDLIQPLANQNKVDVKLSIANALPDIPIHPVALDQILLNLLSVALRMTSYGTINIFADQSLWEIVINIHGHKVTNKSQTMSEDDDNNLKIARQLAELCQSNLVISDSDSTFSARLTLPGLEQLPVLVIDDNEDTLEFITRCTSGTRYRALITRDPEKAVSIAQELSPRIILLDVMMPQIDGWKILMRLKNHPATANIPVIICTILAQEELALSLGASSFVRKPFTRQTILAALDHQMEKVSR